MKSVDRTLKILEKVVNSDNGISVTEISNCLNIHKSTTHRLLSTLVYRGYIKKDGNNLYFPGIKLLEIGSLTLNKSDMRQEIKPYLEKLMQITEETIHLGVLDNYEVIYIDKVESPHTIRMYSSVGKRAPVHCTGLGKTLLAFSEEETIEEFLSLKKLEKYTKNTITDPDKFKKHLKKIKDRGYAVDNQEHEDNINCISAPIFNHQGEAIAAFSISGPANRMTLKRVKELKSLILEYSQKISLAFGYYKK